MAEKLRPNYDNLVCLTSYWRTSILANKSSKNSATEPVSCGLRTAYAFLRGFPSYLSAGPISCGISPRHPRLLLLFESRFAPRGCYRREVKHLCPHPTDQQIRSGSIQPIWTRSSSTKDSAANQGPSQGHGIKSSSNGRTLPGVAHLRHPVTASIGYFVIFI